MPILWKASFEQPLINMINSGQISNSSAMVDAITTFYDASIKQGLGNGTPGFVQGNIAGFKAALTAFFTAQAAKQNASTTTTYLALIKSINAKGNELKNEIATNQKLLAANKNEQAKLNAKINKLSQSKDIVDKRQIASTKSELALAQRKQAEYIASINSATNKLATVVKAPINDIQKQLQKVSAETLNPASQPPAKPSVPKPYESKAQQAQKDKQKITSIYSDAKELTQMIAQVNILNLLVSAELSRIDRNKKYYDTNKNVHSALNKYNSGQATRYASITNPIIAIAFLTSILLDTSNIKSSLSGKKSKLLDVGVTNVKNTISKKLVNPDSQGFNAALRTAVTAYWSGMPQIGPGGSGVVSFPGVVTIPVPMVQTPNNSDFVQDISKTLQAHTKTVSGQWIIPGSPPVVIPWTGYS